MKSVIIFFILFLGFIYSCSERESLIFKEIIVQHNEYEKINLSSFVENFKIVKLATDDEGLIFEISKAQYINDKIYLLDIPGNCLFVFNKDGQLEGKIRKTGQGPGEFIQITDFYIDRNSILYLLDFGQQAIMKYDDSFDFVEKINYTSFGSRFVQNNNRFMIYNEPSGKKNDYQLSILDQDGEIDSELLARDFTRHKYNWSGANVFFLSDNEKYFSLRYNDTIYSFTENDIVPEFVVNFQKRKFPDQENINDYDIMSLDFPFLVKHNFYITNKYVVFDYMYKQSRFFTIYDIHEDVSRSGLVENDMILNFRFFPRWGNDNYLIEELSADLLVNDFSDSPQLAHQVSITKEEDNPIIIIYQLKV